MQVMWFSSSQQGVNITALQAGGLGDHLIEKYNEKFLFEHGGIKDNCSRGFIGAALTCLRERGGQRLCILICATSIIIPYFISSAGQFNPTICDSLFLGPALFSSQL